MGIPNRPPHFDTKDGPQNYSFWDNKEFQALSPQIDREVDASKRLAVIRQAEAGYGK
ncbi:MAG: hypothetical protein WA633_21310 [Stellaceae bacterium]